MTVLMSKRKLDALNSVDRDRGLLTDKAAMERAVYHGGPDGDKMPSEKERVQWDRFRQEVGK